MQKKKKEKVSYLSLFYFPNATETTYFWQEKRQMDGFKDGCSTYKEMTITDRLPNCLTLYAFTEVPHGTP